MAYGCSIRIENSVTRDNKPREAKQSASLLMPNSYPRDGIFNPHIATIKDSYILQRHIRRSLSCYKYLLGRLR